MTEKSKSWLYIDLIITSQWGTKHEFFLHWNMRYKILFPEWKFHVKILTATEVIQKNVLG